MTAIVEGAGISFLTCFPGKWRNLHLSSQFRSLGKLKREQTRKRNDKNGITIKSIQFLSTFLCFYLRHWKSYTRNLSTHDVSNRILVISTHARSIKVPIRATAIQSKGNRLSFSNGNLFYYRSYHIHRVYLPSTQHSPLLPSGRE